MKKILSYIILFIAIFFTANLYGQIGTVIPDERLPYENDGVTLSWTLAGYDGEIPELDIMTMIQIQLSSKTSQIRRMI